MARLDRSLGSVWCPGRGRPWRSLAAMKAASTDWKVMHVKPSAAWGDLRGEGEGLGVGGRGRAEWVLVAEGDLKEKKGLGGCLRACVRLLSCYRWWFRGWGKTGGCGKDRGWGKTGGGSVEGKGVWGKRGGACGWGNCLGRGHTKA